MLGLPVTFVATLLAGAVVTDAAVPPDGSPSFAAEATGNAVSVAGLITAAASAASALAPTTEQLEQFEERERCEANGQPGVCFPGTREEVAIRACGGEPPSRPVWRRERSSAEPWSEWENTIAVSTGPVMTGGLLKWVWVRHSLQRSPCAPRWRNSV